MLGKEMGYEISTCQMQYDANNKEKDKKDPFLYTLEGMVLKNVESIDQVSRGHYHKWFAMEYTSATFALRLIRPLASWDKIFTLRLSTRGSI